MGVDGRKNIKYLTTFGSMCPGKFISHNVLIIIMAFLIENDIFFNVKDITPTLLNPINFSGNIPLSGDWIKEFEK